MNAGSLGALLGPDAILPDDLVACDATVTSRAEVDAWADRLARRLHDLGIESGQPVVTLVPTSAEAVASWFGIWRAGGVVVPVNPRLAADEIERIVADVRPAATVAGLDLRPEPVHTGSGPNELDPDVALVLYTSGTTGRPKPVQLRHTAVVEGLDTVLAKLRSGSKQGSTRSGPGRDDADRRPPMPNLIPVSLSLWAGIYNTLFSFRVGSPVVLLPRFDPMEFAEIVAAEGIRSTVLPPAMIAMLTESEVDDLSPLRLVRSITAPLAPIQARRFHEKFGIAVLNSYGQTELGGEVIGWNAADARAFGTEKLGAIGRPHDGIEIRFDDEELCVRSPYMMKGYLDDEARARLTDDGYLRTGDLGYLDDDGFVWLTGRVSDVINRGGLKVFPADVEEVLLQHPSVREVAVAGIADDRLGEVPWAFFVASGDVGDDDLEALCRAHLAPYKVPTRFVAVDRLPRNEVGKVLRRDLADEFAPGGPTS
jgi:long-chain acyl-CoA synthetase